MSYVYHATVLVSDLKRSLRFYDGLFEQLGWSTHSHEEGAKAWSDGKFDFWITQAKDVQPQRRPDGPGIDHLAFRVETKQEVDSFFEWLQMAEAKVEIPPRLFPEYRDSYYAVFFFDPDGTRLEVAFA